MRLCLFPPQWPQGLDARRGHTLLPTLSVALPINRQEFRPSPRHSNRPIPLHEKAREKLPHPTSMVGADCFPA